MAVNLWGKVYYNGTFAGILRQEPGDRCVFTYDDSYLQSALLAISYTLPLQSEPHDCAYGLHPFFDNLCAEGWLKNAQMRALGLRRDDRFALLLAFGSDLAGAVSVIDPAGEMTMEQFDSKNIVALVARASLSGVQPKLGAIKEDAVFRAAEYGHAISLSSRQVHFLIFWNLSTSPRRHVRLFCRRYDCGYDFGTACRGIRHSSAHQTI